MVRREVSVGEILRLSEGPCPVEGDDILTFKAELELSEPVEFLDVAEIGLPDVCGRGHELSGKLCIDLLFRAEG